MRERKHEYIPGSWLMTCDECGRVFHNREMKKRWDGFWVCRDDWEPRHPQLDVRAKKDKIRVPKPRPYDRGFMDLEMLDGLVMADALIMGARNIISTAITRDDL